METTLTKDLEDMVNRNYHLEVGKLISRRFIMLSMTSHSLNILEYCRDRGLLIDLCLVDLQIFFLFRKTYHLSSLLFCKE